MKYPDYIVDMYKERDEVLTELDRLIALGFGDDSIDLAPLYDQLDELEDEIREECYIYLSEIGAPVDEHMDMNLWMEDLEVQAEQY